MCLTGMHVHVLCIVLFLRGLDYSTTWRDSYDESREILADLINITHPVMQAILNLWHQQNFELLVDFSNIR